MDKMMAVKGILEDDARAKTPRHEGRR